MVKDLTIIAIMSAVLLIQETALSFLPGIQFTFLLIMIYSRVFGFKRAFLIVLIHVLLDNLVMGSFNVIIILPMLISYTLISLSLQFIKTKNNIVLAFISIIYSFGYCWLFIPSGMIIQEIDFIAYLKADLIFEIILAAANFLAVLWLYKPLEKVLREQYEHYSNIKES